MASTTSLSGNRRSFAIIASGVVIIVSAFVLIGWTIGSHSLTQVLPGFPVMVPNTALSALALALALAWCSYTRGSNLSRIFAIAAGTFASLIGGLTIAHYLSGINFGLDQIFFPFAQTVVFETRPGRMSPHTALTLVAIGPAIAFLSRNKRAAHISEICTAFVIFMAWSAFLGYLFDAKLLRGLSNTNAMALPTAFSFLILSFGALAANPRSLIAGMLTNKSLGGVTMRRLLPVAVLAPTIIGFIEWYGIESSHFNIGFGIATSTLFLCAILVFIFSYFSLAIHRSDRKRRAIERDLEIKEEIYRNLVDYGMGLICSHDLSGKILSINPAALRILGYRQSDIVGRNLRSVVEPALRAEFDAYLREVTNKGIAGGLLRLMAHDGRAITFRYNNVLITDGRSPLYILGHAQDVSELLDVQEKLRQHSMTDALTGLYNRRGFLIMAEQQIKLEKRRGTTRGLTLLFADLDGLKSINDTFGHEAGNDAIVEFASIIRSCTRSADLGARWGGDEFVILLIGQTSATANTSIDRIRERIKLYNETSSKSYELAFSVGFADFDIESGRSLEEQIADADGKMYEDKRRRKQSRDDLVETHATVIKLGKQGLGSNVALSRNLN